MIRLIEGTLVDKDMDTVVILAAGVGYGLTVPLSVMEALPPLGEQLRLYSYLAVREDAFQLYGFLYKEEREMFVRLLAVNGVGPKAALGLLSALGVRELRLAVLSGDVKTLSRAPGIGSKTAQRIILDLKDKIDAAETFGEMLAAGAEKRAGGGSALGEAQKETVQALVALGYSQTEALKALTQVEADEDMDTNTLLRLCLRHMS